MITITRILEWDSGHRVLGHEGKCRHLHGHRYKAEITVTSPELDSIGRVIDFSVIKKEVGEWIDKHWDHNLILHVNDPLNEFDTAHDIFQGKAPYILSCNPTAENLAEVLFWVAYGLLTKYQITAIRVRIWETPNSFADYTGTPR